MLLRNSAVLWRELEGEAILLLPEQSCSYTLNSVGTLIWRLLDGQHTPEAIAQAICQAYKVEPEQALQHIQRFLNELRDQHLLDESTPGATPEMEPQTQN